MSEFKQSAKVKDGKLIPDSPGTWRAGIAEYEGGPVVVVVRTPKREKTLRQLGYYRGCLLPFFVEQWSRERRQPQGLPPYDPEQIHEILVKHTIGYQEDVGPLGEPVRKMTRESDTVEMGKLIDGCRQLAWDLWQVNLPLPGEEWEAVSA
jgi:hypothetical protein